MTKKLVVVLMIVCFMGAGMSLFARGGDLKKKDLAWLRISITEGKKEIVKIKLPLTLITLLEDSFDRDLEIDGKKVSLQEIVDVLKKSGGETLIEVEDVEEGQHIKIWIE